MITISQRPPDFDAVPQAIFWRPIHYFSDKIRLEQDDLDEFKFVCYTIGNLCNLEIRTYRGHNNQTATLFLSRGGDLKLITEAIDLAIKVLQLPSTSVAWRRGIPFEHGVLNRPARDRLREVEARTIMLKIAATKPSRCVLMRDIRAALPRYFDLTAEDLKISKTRKGEPLWHQIVRNVVSHQKSPTGPFVRGLATIEGSKFSVTNGGLTYLKSIGFLS